MPTDNDSKQIEILLKKLTWWQRESGLSVDTTSEIRSSGESNAAIEEIKRELAKLGARIRWSDSSREWRLDNSS